MGKTINYGPAISTPEGVLYSAQTSAGRTKKAWVIVRYNDLDDPGEIIYEDGAVIETLWCAPDGHLHAMCRKGFHHTNEGGAWKKTRVKKGSQQGYLVWGHGDRLFLSVDSEVYERRAGGYELSLPAEVAHVSHFVSSMHATPAALYASRGDGHVWRLTDRWERVRLPRTVGPSTVICVSEDEIYVSTRIGLFRGRGAGDLELVDETPLQYGTLHQGRVIVANYSRGVFRVNGNELEPLANDFSVTRLDGSGAYLCSTGMAPEIRIFDGTQWRQKVA